MKIVLDTNVLLSGLMAPEGAPGRIVKAWFDARFDVGDRDLLDLRGEHPIQTPAEFVRRL